MTVWLRGIQPEVSYELRSSDRGRMGQVNGRDLVAGGFQIREAPESASQVFVLAPLRHGSTR